MGEIMAITEMEMEMATGTGTAKINNPGQHFLHPRELNRRAGVFLFPAWPLTFHRTNTRYFESWLPLSEIL
jgi:hypothetical protein